MGRPIWEYLGFYDNSPIFLPTAPHLSNFAGMDFQYYGASNRHIEIAVNNMNDTQTFQNLQYAVSQQIGVSRVIFYSNSFVQPGTVANSRIVEIDGELVGIIQIGILQSMLVNGNTVTLDEIIFHEMAHLLDPPDLGYNSQYTIRLTNGFRSELGLEYRYSHGDGVYQSGLPMPLHRYNPKCFTAQTPILLPNHTTKPIADITIGDTVMAFNALGDLTPRKVTKLYRNTTDEWLELTFADKREALVVTPGHEFLTPEGTFAPIEKLATFGGAQIVLADGTTALVTVRRITYNAQTAHLFEASQMVGALDGNLALKPWSMMLAAGRLLISCLMGCTRMGPQYSAQT